MIVIRRLAVFCSYRKVRNNIQTAWVITLFRTDLRSEWRSKSIFVIWNLYESFKRFDLSDYTFTINSEFSLLVSHLLYFCKFCASVRFFVDPEIFSLGNPPLSTVLSIFHQYFKYFRFLIFLSFFLLKLFTTPTNVYVNFFHMPTSVVFVIFIAILHSKICC